MYWTIAVMAAPQAKLQPSKTGNNGNWKASGTASNAEAASGAMRPYVH
jgi:hypothetical protein